MKLAIVFLLFSIAVLSDAFTRTPKEIATIHFSLFNLALDFKGKNEIRDICDVQPDTDAKADQIIAKYYPYTYSVKHAVFARPGRISAVVFIQPKENIGPAIYRMFRLQANKDSVTGWKIILE